MPGLGHKSYVQIAKESTWGTFVAPDASARGQRLELTSWNVNPSISALPDASLYAKQSRRAMYQGGLVYKGSFSLRANYEGLEELLRAAFGSATRTTVSGKVGDFTFTESATLPSLSIEAVMGEVGGAGKSFNLSGAKITSITFKASAGTGTDAMLMIDCNVIAKDMTANNTVTANTGANLVTYTSCCNISGTTVTLTSGNTTALYVGMTVSGTGIPDGAVVYAKTDSTHFELSLSATTGTGVTLTCVGLSAPRILPVLFHHAVAASTKDGTTDAAADVRIRSIECTMESPHAEDRFYLSSLNIDEPVRQDFLSVKWKLTQEFNTTTQFNAARSFTSGVVKVLFKNAAIDLNATGNSPELELRSNTAYVTDFSSPVDSYGVLVSTSTWEATYDTTDATALLARVRNTRPALA